MRQWFALSIGYGAVDYAFANQTEINRRDFMITNNGHAFDINEDIVFVAADETRRGNPHFVISRPNREFIGAAFIRLRGCDCRVWRRFVEAVPDGYVSSGERLVQRQDM